MKAERQTTKCQRREHPPKSCTTGAHAQRARHARSRKCACARARIRDRSHPCRGRRPRLAARCDQTFNDTRRPPNGIQEPCSEAPFLSF